MRVREGIALMGASDDYYYEEIRRASMEWFLSRARSGHSVEAFEKANHEAPWEFILGSHFDVTRGSWKYITALPPAGYGRVLDLGSGWGVNAIALAPHADEVVAVDPSWHRLLNLKLRASSLGLDNITILTGGDRPRLPFPDAHFDLVILVGVIEWVAVGRSGDPRKHQSRALQEVARVLHRRGEVFLASEKRYAYGYWTGRPDDHTGLLFGSLLPRPLAHLYSRLRRGTPYQNYTYSRAQYTRLLRNAGLRLAEFHGILPAHRSFVKIFPLGQGRIVDRDETRGSRVKDTILRRRITAPLASAFGIRAAKSSLAESFLQRLGRHLRDTLAPAYRVEPGPYRLLTTNFSVKVTFRGTSGSGGVLELGPLLVPYFYDRLCKHWVASDSYGFGHRFLIAAHRQVLHGLPALAARSGVT